MPKKQKRLSFSDELRQAVERSGLSRYAIGAATGLDEGSLSKFMAGERGLRMESIDKLADLLRLHIVSDAEVGRPNVKRGE
jgi:transcriptional regulator with XRE-family HTH domain